MRDRAVPHELAAFGEISLAGEVRPVTSASQRRSEARRLGYSTILDVESGSVRAAVERAMMAATSGRERELDAAF
jgi:DNA repair protein RadA/Sms